MLQVLIWGEGGILHERVRLRFPSRPRAFHVVDRSGYAAIGQVSNILKLIQTEFGCILQSEALERAIYMCLTMRFHIPISSKPDVR